MTIWIRIIILNIALLTTNLLVGQNPPEVCAKLLVGLQQDSVLWQATPCANFGGYVILGQENNTGPFVALDTVNVTNFVNSNPAEVPWNYQVGMICNGTLTNLSSTVSNQPPITPDLRSVNIVGGVPVVSWDPSPSPEVIGYQIYKENPYGSGNYFPYPAPNITITTTSFADNNATSLLARYAILAVSTCNKSLLGVGGPLDGTTGPHTSMVIDGRIDTCSQAIYLSWNGYENWRDGVQQYEIWLQKNGGNWQVVDTVAATATSYVFQNAQDNDLLEFQLRAIEQNKNNEALSNTLLYDVRVNRPMDFIHLTRVSVNTSDEIDVEWTWDTDVDYGQGDLLRGVDSNDLSGALNLPVIGSAQNSYNDINAAPQTNTYFYQVQTTDACGHEVESNFAKTILLEVEAQDDFKNKITWSAPYIEYGTLQDYELYKDGQKIATIPAGVLSYVDELNVKDQNEVSNCYWIVANMNITFPDNAFYSTESQSNNACATQGSNIHVPNAVSPNGENTEFRPVVVFSNSIQNYTMQIYDRYGALVFESNDLFDAWDGTKNGAPLRQGVYVYTIRFQAANGDWIKRKGTVMLIR